jgi:hypothetical protein
MRHPAQLLNVNRFRQRCLKARPDTPISPYYSNLQIAFVLFAELVRPEGFEPDILVRSAIPAYTWYNAKQRNPTKQRESVPSNCLVLYGFVPRSRTKLGHFSRVDLRNVRG